MLKDEERDLGSDCETGWWGKSQAEAKSMLRMPQGIQPPGSMQCRWLSGER